MESKSSEALAKVLWYYNLICSVTPENQKIVCPFHDDVNPSLTVNLIENKWYCFGCGLSGDAITFVKYMEKKYNGLNDLQAYKKYLQILKSDKCSDIHINAHYKDKTNKQVSKDLYNEAYDYYHGLRKIDWREVQEIEAIESKKYMTQRGFTAKTLNKCGAKITYNKNYSIVFPMLDNGIFKGWVCRTTIKSVEEKRKYLYNTGFSRANTLVGSYGKGNLDFVIVVEGYMDRLKFVQYGAENVVAILGWKMSQQQIQKLKDKGITKVISALDNDDCGRKGTEYLKKHFEVTRFRYLKGIKDVGATTKDTFDKMYKKTMKEFYRE